MALFMMVAAKQESIQQKQLKIMQHTLEALTALLREKIKGE
jgi:hypothetical protein